MSKLRDMIIEELEAVIKEDDKKLKKISDNEYGNVLIANAVDRKTLNSMIESDKKEREYVEYWANWRKNTLAKYRGEKGN